MKRAAYLVAGIIVVALALNAQHFPPLDRDNPPKSRKLLRDQYCMTARTSIPSNSGAPLMTYDFAAPGASGTALIDGKTVKIFRNQQHLRIYADVSRGNHQFKLDLDTPAILMFMVSNDDFKYCKP